MMPADDTETAAASTALGWWPQRSIVDVVAALIEGRRSASGNASAFGSVAAGGGSAKPDQQETRQREEHGEQDGADGQQSLQR